MAAPPPPQQQQPMMEHQREPCPDRILDDIGGAFAMGAVGGGAWHFIRGMRNSPPGFRVRGALESLRKESPRLGGSFANWGLAFSCFDCSLQYVRKKEDPWNAIAAGALTGGFLQLRFGLKSAAKSAAFGGVLLALIEGLGIAINKMSSPAPPGVPFQPPPTAAPTQSPGPTSLDAASAFSTPTNLPNFSSSSNSSMPPTPADSAASNSGGSWWSSMFGGGNQAAQPADSASKVDPFAPPPPPPEFSAEFKTDPGFRS
ncbi:hypothetical protein QJQ45_025905 [Haematococcus lacustris]|nr:hypothetical protein QJQ45_025905 [Haematococcus lacustris]